MVKKNERQERTKSNSAVIGCGYPWWECEAKGKFQKIQSNNHFKDFVQFGPKGQKQSKNNQKTIHFH